MNGGTRSGLGSLHDRLVHRRVRVDRACETVCRHAQTLGKRRLGDHLRNVVSYEVRTDELVVGIEDELYESVALACRRRLARGRILESSDLALYALLPWPDAR